MLLIPLSGYCGSKKIGSCTFVVPDDWDSFMKLQKMLETGDPTRNRLSGICKQLPNRSFKVVKDGKKSITDSFIVENNGCTFKVRVEEKRGRLSVYADGISKCKNKYSVINKENSNGYTIWSLKCSNGKTAWVNNSKKHFYEYGGVSMGQSKSLDEAMKRACGS